MARDPDHLAGSLDSENTGGLLTGFLAEEEEFDGHALWRLASWGAGSVGAVIVALLAQSSIGPRRDQVAAADLVRQSQQIQSIARESQSETRRLVSAIETLNGDRDRLYSRVTVLEQGLDSVTGAIPRQPVAAGSAQAAATPSASTEPQPAAQNPPPAPVLPPAATTVAAAAEKPRTDTTVPQPAAATVASAGQSTQNAPATSLMASKSMLAPPDTSVGKLIEPEKPANAAAAAPKPDKTDNTGTTEVVTTVPPSVDAESDSTLTPAAKVAVQRTEFGVDVGGANSVGGLRALWRGLLKSRSNAALTTLRPIMVIKESNNGLGMQLRLVAGPLIDAAAAAKICAGLIENERPCETTVYDGQRLAMKTDEPAAAAAKPATTAKPAARRRSWSKRVVNDEPAKKPESSSTFSSLFGRR